MATIAACFEFLGKRFMFYELFMVPDFSTVRCLRIRETNLRPSEPRNDAALIVIDR
jgi:hypothetical protein